MKALRHPLLALAACTFSLLGDGLPRAPIAHAQSSPNACAATVVTTAGGPALRLPYLRYNGSALTADLVIDTTKTTPGTALRVASVTPQTSSSVLSSCVPSTLTSDFVLNVPHADLFGTPFQIAMALDAARFPGVVAFDLVGAWPIRFVTQSTTFQNELSIAASEALVINNSATPSATTITVNGPFVCRGPLEILNDNTSVTVVVSGSATLACPVRFAGDSANNKLTIVASGAIEVSDGFGAPSSGHVIVTDDDSLIRSPDTYLSDAVTDDGSTPSIMPASDNQAASVPLPGLAAAAPARLHAMAADCAVVGTHRLRGRLAPPAHRRLIGPESGTTGVVLATWFKCDVEVRDVNVEPPQWDTPSPANQPETTARRGRKGLTLNLRSNGKVKFAGQSTFHLMDGGRGQSKTVYGNPAVATAGDGGESGDLKIAAPGGIEFATGATLRIVPGRGGDGGDANAIGDAGSNGCPGLSGGAATATGGRGADSKKLLRARGFDPTGKVLIDDVIGGNGGAAVATAGNGGNGNPGQCSGGAGGEATAQGGRGGDATFRYVGTGTVDAVKRAGHGGLARAVSGTGGNGGDRTSRCDLGGNGGRGGNGTARGGAGGGGTGAVAGLAGGTDAGGGNGTGGLCGNWKSSNGLGGNWAEYSGANFTRSGTFASGNKDCSCVLTGEPKVSPQPGELQFNHSIGGSPCPQTIGSVVMANGGGGDFRWSLGALPAWLSASRTSGVAGDTVQFSFTCTGFSSTVSTTIPITVTNSATNQPITSGNLPLVISGTVR